MDTPSDDLFDININENAGSQNDHQVATLRNEATPSAPSAPSVYSSSSSKSASTASKNPDRIQITVDKPEKVGEGMGSFIVYSVNTRTTMPVFRKPEMSVKRRFSDFLGLHEKLQGKHLPSGRLIPPAPEKSVIGSTKLKIIKEELNNVEFLERRRHTLERFLNRIAQRECLLMDPDFREFLEFEGDLPRASNTAALSGAGVLRLFKNVGEAVNKFTYKMDEQDQWFEEKQADLDNLERQLSRLLGCFENLVYHRQEMAQNTHNFVQSCSLLANVEEDTTLSRSLSKLCETEGQIEQIQTAQSQCEFQLVAEMLRDNVQLIGSVRDILHERVKSHKAWKDASAMLTKKREQKVKLELANKSDKIPAAEKEVQEWDMKTDRAKADFDLVSKTVRQEIEEFDLQRVHEFKDTFIRFLEESIHNQEQVIRCWEAYLPEAKASL